jgi:REP element-mobilizing transposase RayT
MAGKHLSLLVHFIWSTAGREPWIGIDWQEDLYGYIGGIMNNKNARLICAGGMSDHIHLYASLPSTITIADFVSVVKSNSSRWIHQSSLEQLRERLGKFGLELHPEKTRLIEFGRFAAKSRRERGQGKPETFDFSGFRHICGTTHKTGRFIVRRETIGKRMSAKLKEIQAELKRRRHKSNVNTVKWLQSVVRGYFQYHAIPDNWARLEAFRKEVLRLWLRQLRRRSQRSRWTWERFSERLGVLLPEIRVLHPYPNVRFDAKYPR